MFEAENGTGFEKKAEEQDSFLIVLGKSPDTLNGLMFCDAIKGIFREKYWIYEVLILCSIPLLFLFPIY